MLMFVIALVVMGIIAGYLARLIVPGPDPMSFLQTVLLGIVGSFVGGLLGYLVFDTDAEEGALQPAGVLGSVVGAIIALLVYNWWGRRRRRGHLTAPPF
jgi:uncharacterized membrane protein YeaQ/YmgE (transglycosylase-associated protein family)